LGGILAAVKVWLNKKAQPLQQKLATIKDSIADSIDKKEPEPENVRE